MIASGTRIMIVEDEPAHAEAIRRSLEAAGAEFSVRVVGTLGEYRRSVLDALPDIALVDLILPDGRALEVNFRPETTPFPFVIMTSYGNEQTAVDALKSGAMDYVVKSPEAFTAMPRIVARALREWNSTLARKRGEEALRESERKFRRLTRQFHALLDTIPDVITRQSPDLRVIWANRAAAEGLGKEATDVVGSYCYTLWHDRTSPCDSCPVQKTFRTGEPALEIVTTPDGKTWELRSVPVKEAGSVVEVVEIGRDVTGHRKLEEQFRQAQKMEAVGRLAGGVAHDFNNMLNVILGYSEMALARLDPGAPLARDLQEILNAGHRSADLTRQLLAFSRKQIVAPRVLNVNKVIEEQLKMLGRLIGEDVRIDFLRAGDLWNNRIDPSQVGQILANLSVNARDAIAGAGTFTIETANVAVDEAYCREHQYVSPGEYVMLSFSDTGAGMDAVTRERIFEPFFTTKGEGKGTGLGMSTVYGIVKQNGGFVHVYSEPGQGTAIQVYLPRVQDDTEDPVEKAAEGSLSGTETVLIVEDEEQILLLSRRILEQYGYRVLTARTPEDACRLAEEQEGDIHLLLTDVILPVMNGKELQERIEAVRPGIKTLFMSGYTANAIARRGILEKGVAFLQKPFSLTSLAVKVRRTLDSPKP